MLQKEDYMLQKFLPKKVVNKIAEATRELIGAKIAEKTLKPKLMKISMKNVEEIAIPQEIRQEILNKLRKVF